MALVKDNQYIDSEKLSKTTKRGNRVIGSMSKGQIASYLAYECRVGLWATIATIAVGFIAWDKVVRLFI
jgi:hypothetical protein